MAEIRLKWMDARANDSLIKFETDDRIHNKTIRKKYVWLYS